MSDTPWPVYEVLPTKARFSPDEPVRVEVRGLREYGQLALRHLGEVVATRPVRGSGVIDLGCRAPGGYGVELTSGVGGCRTAVEVHDGAAATMRYGFVASYAPDRDLRPVADLVRRLHLTDVQLYDWAYRHADLMGGGALYADALGQEISLATVRAVVDALHDAGARALGYAAVYAVGADEWPRWQHLALLTPTGAPYALGDFLRVVDPAAPEWSQHFTADLATAATRLHLDGFHLDQYGWPKRAVRADGVRVDLAESFSDLVSAVRRALPGGRLVFNQVNDFPTWRTGRSPQDAVYVEVWEPHRTLADLARVASRAQCAGGGKPVVVAAYQHVYDSAETPAADLATSFTMATLFSHGATQLLAGEGDRVLVDPYYVRNHPMAGSTAALLRRWYDFLVEHTEMLAPPMAVDVTGSYAGDYNDDCDVAFSDTAVSEEPVAGSVWRRVIAAGNSLVVHLVNLRGQEDTLWDAPRRPVDGPGPGRLRMRRWGPGVPRVRVADPDRSPHLVDVPVEVDGDHAFARLPEPHVWQLVVVDQPWAS